MLSNYLITIPTFIKQITCGKSVQRCDISGEFSRQISETHQSTAKHSELLVYTEEE